MAAKDRPLVGSADSLYVAAGNEVDSRVLRLDPATGALLARSALSVDPAAAMPLLVDGTLWVDPSSARSGDVLVHGLDPKTLRSTTTVGLHAASGTQITGFTASALEHRLFVGLGATVKIISTRTGTVTGSYHAPDGALSDIAVSPDSDRLYVTYTQIVGDDQYSYLAVLSADTGQAIGEPVRLRDGNGGALTSSLGGVWVTIGSGMEQSIYFSPADDLRHFQETPAAGGGGIPPTVTATDRVVWEGGDLKLVCADPNSGRIRSAAQISTPHGSTAFITSLTAAGTKLFAEYRQPSSGRTQLVRLAPPHSCT